jgi:hypothetical protein
MVSAKQIPCQLGVVDAISHVDIFLLLLNHVLLDVVGQLGYERVAFVDVGESPFFFGLIIHVCENGIEVIWSLVILHLQSRKSNGCV